MIRPRRRTLIIGIGAIVVILAAVVVAVVVGSGHGSKGSKPPSATPTTLPAPPSSVSPARGVVPTVQTADGRQVGLVGLGQTFARTPGAVSVLSFGAKPDGSTDDTAAFAAAMNAALASGVRYANGPSGPQAVVYVPAGTYRLLRLTFLSNLRLEVDAAAVLEQAGGVTPTAVKKGDAPWLIVWDGPSARVPLTNVSIVGVGTSSGGTKKAADPVQAGWSIQNCFTFDLDPKATNASQLVSAIDLVNVNGFLIENVFSIQNASPPPANTANASTNGGQTPWPISMKAVFVFRPRSNSPPGGPYYDPQNGEVIHHYNIDGPYGFGPNQVTSGHNLKFSQIYSLGGTALRLETDATLKKSFGGEVKGVTADTIIGVDCNRAVSFAPHAQQNSDVHISLVVAISCHQGVIESIDEKLAPGARGSFTNSTVTAIDTLTGNGAQVPLQSGGSAGAWTVASATQAYAKDKNSNWAVSYTAVACQGAFQRPSDPLLIDGRVQTLTCK